MNNKAPSVRGDLDFFPVEQDGRQFVVIRDHLGLVQEGRAVARPLFQVMALLDGTRSVSDLQVMLTRQSGGVLIRVDDLERILEALDESFLLDSERFRSARDGVIAEFTAKKIRTASHSGLSYPADGAELSARLNEILSCRRGADEGKGRVKGIVSPHIDLSVGCEGYAGAYRAVRGMKPSRVVVLGIGHHMTKGLFCVTEKDFETPLGIVRNERTLTRSLLEEGGEAMADNDFFHRSEHSVEFQVVFLRHIFRDFTLVPILCGSLPFNLEAYTRRAYLEAAAPFLDLLKEILTDPAEETLLVAGVDLSHAGPKFGHELSAVSLQRECEAHDRKLLDCLTRRDAEGFWQESIRVNDRFNVCGFSALACLLEILPPCRGELVHYEFWHEEATRSGVSFSAAVFTS